MLKDFPRSPRLSGCHGFTWPCLRDDGKHGRAGTSATLSQTWSLGVNREICPTTSWGSFKSVAVVPGVTRGGRGNFAEPARSRRTASWESSGLPKTKPSHNGAGPTGGDRHSHLFGQSCCELDPIRLQGVPRVLNFRGQASPRPTRPRATHAAESRRLTAIACRPHIFPSSLGRSPDRPRHGHDRTPFATRRSMSPWDRFVCLEDSIRAAPPIIPA